MLPILSFGPLSVSTYFLTISLASTLGVLWFVRRARAKDMNYVTAIDIALLCLVSGFVGARLLHVLYEEPEFYRANPWRLVQVWYGGFVFLGGLLLGLAAVVVFCERRREPLLLWLDLGIIPLSLTYALGRVACFFNGCCFGRQCDLPWAVMLAGERRHPTQLYATFLELMILAWLLLRERRPRASGLIFSTWLILHGTSRIVMEYFRDDPRGAPIAGLSLSTWLSLILVVAGGVLMRRLPKTA